MAVHSIDDYVPHHRTREKLDRTSRPVKVSEQLPRGSAGARFNSWFVVKVSSGVGTMWCAYAFAALALVSLPEAITSHSAVTLVSWVSQTFLQLALLWVIVHLGAQDDVLRRLLAEHRPRDGHPMAL